MGDYEVTKDGMELARKEVSVTGKPECKVRQVAVAIAKGHMVYSMGYDEYIKNAKSEFIKEENLYEN